MAGPEILMRREKAGDKARKVQRILKQVEFRIEDDDILFLTGPYHGQYVRALFHKGPVERDYIVKYVWFQHDEEAVRIINSLTCR